MQLLVSCLMTQIPWWLLWNLKRLLKNHMLTLGDWTNRYKKSRYTLIAKEQPCKHGGSLIKPCAKVPRLNESRIDVTCSNVTLHLWRNAEQIMHCFQANLWYRTENPVLIPYPNHPQPIVGWIHLHHTGIGKIFSCWHLVIWLFLKNYVFPQQGR